MYSSMKIMGRNSLFGIASKYYLLTFCTLVFDVVDAENIVSESLGLCTSVLSAEDADF